MYGIISSKNPFQDNTVHVVDSDDSETTHSNISKPKSRTVKTSHKPISSKPKACASLSKVNTKTPLLESKTLETQYIEKWKDKLVVNDKTIDVEGLKKGEFNVEEIFDQLGWNSFYLIDEPRYPRLVKTSYAIVDVSKGDTCISIILKGVHIEITPNMS